MASGEARTYTEPNEFAAGILGAKVDLTIVGSGRFDAAISTVQLNALKMQRISANLPLVSHMRSLGGRSSFIFNTRPGASLIRDGEEVKSASMVRVGTPQSHFQRSPGPVDWGVISIPLENVPSAAIAGFDLTPPPWDQIITPRPDAMANLERLHRAAATVVVEAPELIASSEVVRGMEQILLQALVTCLESDDVRDQTSVQRRHHKIMQRFHSVLKANPGRPLYVLEMAEAVGASLRSLSVCCQEHLGIGPKKYLMLRRMHLARQALTVANLSAATVTDVATKYGFWQFGRFAGKYKELFGEAPSATLRRPASR